MTSKNGEGVADSTPKKKRTRLDIWADVLRATEGGDIKTHIIYKSNTNFTVFGEILDELLGMGLMQIDTTRPMRFTVYTTTDRGREWLEWYDGRPG